MYDRNNEIAVGGENRTTGEPASAGRGERSLVVEHPLVRTKWAMKPHCVVEAGHLYLPIRPTDAVRQQGGVQQGHVAGVSDDAGVQQVVVGQFAVGTHPHTLAKSRVSFARTGIVIDVSNVDGARSVVPLAELRFVGLHANLEVGQRLGARHIGGHRQLIIESWLGGVKARLQIENYLAVLNCNDTTSRKTCSVAKSVNFIKNWNIRVAGSNEIGVQRVNFAADLIHGACRRDECLTSNLTAEDSLTILIGTIAAKDVHLNLFDIQQRDEVREWLLGVWHPSMLAEVGSLAFAPLLMLDEPLRTIALTTKGFMPEREGDALFEAATAACQELPGLPMVEVGSYCGRSTVWLGAVAQQMGTQLYAVDHHGGSEENQSGWEWHDKDLVNDEGKIDTLPFFRATMQRAGLTQVVRECVGDSHIIGNEWLDPLACLFIDGGHGRAIARGDSLAWVRHVAVGGSLIIHDVFEKPEDGGQAPYEEIYLPALASGEFAEQSRCGSLRILQRQELRSKI